MNPILFTIWGHPIYTYWVAMSGSVLTLYFLVQLHAPGAGLKRSIYFRLFFPTFFGGLFGGKVFDALLHLKDAKDPINMLFSGGGFSSLGGLIAVVLLTIIILNFLKEPCLPYFDHVTRFGGLAYFIQRTLGCFYGAGCCFGKIIPEASWLAVPYLRDNPDGIIPPAIRCADRMSGVENLVAWVYPTQLFYAALGLIVYLAVNLYNPRDIIPGERTCLFLTMYALGRFFIDFSRYFPEEQTIFFGRLPVSQLFFLIVANVMIALWIFVRTNGTKKLLSSG